MFYVPNHKDEEATKMFEDPRDMPQFWQGPTKSTEIDGMMASFILSEGSRYDPRPGTDVALAIEVSPPEGRDPRTDVFLPKTTEYRPFPDCTAYAIRNLRLFELDWDACQSLMIRSRSFRDLFLAATTARLHALRRLREHGAGMSSDPTPLLFDITPNVKLN